ncbi:hypothetical protein G6F59_016696 [Rhizopus arrhizus]|nr:hypothetical protein G6F59_016696 [Rhizopus arrhizus]
MHEVGIQRLHVIGRDLGVRGVRHGRIQRMPVASLAVAHGLVEVLVGVVADARLFVGRDVGRIDRAQRRLDAQSAGEGLAALGPGVPSAANAALATRAEKAATMVCFNIVPSP